MIYFIKNVLIIFIGMVGIFLAIHMLSIGISFASAANYVSTSQPPHYQVVSGALPGTPPPGNVIFTCAATNCTIVDVALSTDVYCPTGIRITSIGTNLIEVFGATADPPSEIHTSKLISNGQTAQLVNSCGNPPNTGFYKLGYVDYDLYPAAPSAFFVTTTLEGAGSDVSTSGGFTYGEIITTLFLFLIFAIIIYKTLFDWVVGIKIKRWN